MLREKGTRRMLFIDSSLSVPVCSCSCHPKQPVLHKVEGDPVDLLPLVEANGPLYVTASGFRV